MSFRNYKYRRIVATVIVFLALTVLALFTKATAPVLWGILVAAICELINDLRG